MQIKRNTLMISILALFPVVAFAHVGHDGGVHHLLSFTQGFVHPFTGIDHLVVMLLVGVWSVMNTRQWWLAPSAFAVMLLAGAMIGMAGIVPEATESLVAVSLLVIGLMVSFQLKLRVATGAAIIGSFALFHGLAHGAELAHSAAALAGMAFATVCLHLMGLGIGYLLTRSPAHRIWSRVFGISASLMSVGALCGIF